MHASAPAMDTPATCALMHARCLCQQEMVTAARPPRKRPSQLRQVAVAFPVFQMRHAPSPGVADGVGVWKAALGVGCGRGRLTALCKRRSSSSEMSRPTATLPKNETRGSSAVAVYWLITFCGGEHCGEQHVSVCARCVCGGSPPCTELITFQHGSRHKPDCFCLTKELCFQAQTRPLAWIPADPLYGKYFVPALPRPLQPFHVNSASLGPTIIKELWPPPQPAGEIIRLELFRVTG